MTHQPLPTFAGYAGSRQPKMLLCGEAWGASEQELRKPFVGESGKLLWTMLGEAIPIEPALHAAASKMFHYGLAWVKPRAEWLEAVGIGMTNVLALRPLDNKMENVSVAKSDLPDKGKSYPHAAIAQGRYLELQYLPELERLKFEIREASPNIVVALGNTACWALFGTSGIGGIRGTVRSCSESMGGRKATATYHPAGVMRQWAWRPIVVADLMKAWRESASPSIVRPARTIIINPTIEEIESWIGQTLSKSPPFLSVDIETSKGQITCIGFGRSTQEAMVIPFVVGSGREITSYWKSVYDEEKAWMAVSRLLASSVPKLFQNGMYDAMYLLRMGFVINNMSDDSMLLHHSIFPELQKGLGFLGSVYTNEPAWKLMRKHRHDEAGVKADE